MIPPVRQKPSARLLQMPHTHEPFPSSHPDGYPDLSADAIATVPPTILLPYRTARPTQTEATAAIHFFLDDYRFESIWSKPISAERALWTETLLTPDFSLYADMPLVAQRWNTYRNRWCACYWASLGYKLIPAVSWSTPASYEFCFAGLPQNQLIAISTVGVATTPFSLTRFWAGLDAMLEHLQPRHLLVYGNWPAGATPPNIPMTQYPYTGKKGRRV